MVERRIDVSALEAPEPLLDTLAACDELAAGDYLRMGHRMKQCLLYDELARRGFGHDTRRGATAACEVFIWRQGDEPAAVAARSAAATLSPWEEPS